LRERLMEHPAARSMRGDKLKAKAIRGSAWTLAGFGAQQVIRLGSTLILTRLLFPEAFGIMALANVFMVGLQMFSDIGIRPSIIQNKRGEDPDFLNTAWTIQIIRGFALWTIACAIAYPVALLYENATLFPVLCVIGATAAIRGFQTTGYATANRRLSLGKLTIVELITQVVGIVATIVWAVFHPTVWALAGGAIVSSALSISLGFRVLSTHPHRLRWDTTAVRELLRFGKWIFLSTALTFLSQSGDRLLLPKILSINDLTFYTLAMTFLLIPMNVLRQIAGKVLLPVYSEVLNKGGTERVNRVTSKFSILSAPAFAVPLLLLFFGEWLVSVMYDSRYSGAGPALTILSVGGYFAMMRASQFGLMLAAGNSKRAMLSNAVRVLAALPLASAMSVWTGGLEGFCAGMAISEGVSLLFQRSMTRRTVPELKATSDQILLVVLLAAVLVKAVTVW
jgi:O-antigen/teichoic acid export membrane protein